MKKEQKIEKEILDILNEAEELLSDLLEKISRMRSAYEFPDMMQEIQHLKDVGKVKNITTSWIQRRFKVGYSRSIRIKDELIAKKIVEE